MNCAELRCRFVVFGGGGRLERGDWGASALRVKPPIYISTQRARKKKRSRESEKKNAIRSVGLMYVACSITNFCISE